MRGRDRKLLVLVFVSGMTTMAVEMAAARLLAPWFGDSLPVWAALIGLILVYLAVGYWLGGRWADRSPDPATLCKICLWAAFLLALIPTVSRPVLRLAASGFSQMDAWLIMGPLVAALVLLALPVTLLGCVSPFVIRLVLDDPQRGGTTAGRIYALSTVGSLLGTFLPVLVTIPNLGTRFTFTLFAAILWLTAWTSLLVMRARGAWRYVLMVLFVLLLLWANGAGVIKADEELVFEKESAYNYIQVLRWGPGVRLKLNEGYGVQSVYNPTGDLAGGIWDYFLIAPVFNPAPYDESQVQSLCLIGLAAGTVSKSFTRAYGPIPIDGVELDPAIIDVGRRYFAMHEPNLRAIAQDGRAFLAGLPLNRRYDVIALDAYRPPYVPFHLATREFFQLCRDHLSERGVVAVNAARVQDDERLVQALAATMGEVFASVFIVDEPDEGFMTGNSLVVATVRPSSVASWHANAAALRSPLLLEMAQRASGHVRTYTWRDEAQVFTDDRAPVEQLTHSMVLRLMLGVGE